MSLTRLALKRPGIGCAADYYDNCFWHQFLWFFGSGTDTGNEYAGADGL